MLHAFGVQVAGLKRGSIKFAEAWNALETLDILRKLPYAAIIALEPLRSISRAVSYVVANSSVLDSRRP